MQKLSKEAIALVDKEPIGGKLNNLEMCLVTPLKLQVETLNFKSQILSGIMPDITVEGADSVLVQQPS